jgi:hypothetical protein
MKIGTRIGSGKLVHAAEYNQETGEINLYCDSLKYGTYYAVISDFREPTKESVTCQKCVLKL